MKKFDVPETPAELVGRAKERLRKMWDLEDLNLDDPAIFGSWKREDQPEPPKAPTVTERIRDPEVDLEFQLRNVPNDLESLEAGFCNIPSLFPYLGVAFIPSAFGCEVVLREEDQPACHPLFHDPEDVYKLEKPDVRNRGQCKEVFERIAYFQEATDAKIPIRCTDTQDPIDVATQIWHYEDMLTAMYSHPDAVHHFMDLVTDAFIEFTKLQAEATENFFAHGHSAVWHHRGIHVSDDVAAVLSPETYDEFARPYNERVARAFGGVHYHCCLKYEQNLPAIASSEGFMGFDASPDHNDIDVIEECLTGEGVWNRHVGDRQYVDRFRGKVGLMLSVNGDSKQEALDKAKALVE